MSKARLAPIKPSTILHLELLAAVTATDLDQHIKRHLEILIEQTFFWTDSTLCITTSTIKSDALPPLLPTASQRYMNVPTATNGGMSTQYPTRRTMSRGMSASEILSSERWVSGPSFLQGPEESWPTQPELGNLPDGAETNRIKEVYTMDCDTAGGLDHLLQRYSDWHRLKRTVVILLLLKAILRKKPGKRLSEPITVDEIRTTEVAILQYVQGSCFGSNPAKACHIASVQPLKDDRMNLLRVGGRLVNAPISYDAKKPVISPRNHYITTVIIKHCQLCLGHSGTERVLSEIRQHFWIIKGRYTINSFLMHGVPQVEGNTSEPADGKLGQLKSNTKRTTFQPCWRRLFRSFTVKRARSELKRYGCLFTCLTTRAVHLEVSCTLDTDSFINALQRLIARRGKPSEIRSDNGSNFVGGLRKLRQAISEWNSNGFRTTSCRATSSGSSIRQVPLTWGYLGEADKDCSLCANGGLTLQPLDDKGLATLFCSVEAGLPFFFNSQLFV